LPVIVFALFVMLCICSNTLFCFRCLLCENCVTLFYVIICFVLFICSMSSFFMVGLQIHCLRTCCQGAFFRGSIARTTHLIVTHDGSNDAVLSKEVPFGGQNDDNSSVGVCSPKTANIVIVSRETVCVSNPSHSSPSILIHTPPFFILFPHSSARLGNSQLSS